MYIVLKRQDDTNKIVAMMYNKSYAEFVIKDAFSEIIESNPLCTYEIKNEDTLVKKETVQKKGYLYNEKVVKDIVVCSFEILEYDCKNTPVSVFKQSSGINLWENINDEINNRVLRTMDRDSLYQYIKILKTNINLKSNWTSNEYIHLSNEYLKTFKKELYSSIAKKMKRTGKKFS